MLEDTIARLFAPPKGILAMDGSPATLDKRLAARGIEATEANRRRYRELLLTTPDIERYISGAIFHEETLRQTLSDGTPFAEAARARGILVGLKVDQGLAPSPFNPKEEVTRGLGGLRERLQEAKQRWGIRFAKWRGVYRIDLEEGLPTAEDILIDSVELAQYARVCVEEGIVPMVEPEVLMDGVHSIDESARVHREVWSEVVTQLTAREVPLSAVILKASMVVAGSEFPGGPASSQTVAAETVSALTDTLPPELGGVAFLSGGQTSEYATANLNEIAKRGPHQWPVSFSFARALHAPVMERWGGNDAFWEEAQDVFLHRAQMAALARLGRYSEQCERVPENPECAV